MTTKIVQKIYCVHSELSKNIECTPIEEDDLKSGFWFECPICHREIGSMLEVYEG